MWEWLAGIRVQKYILRLPNGREQSPIRPEYLTPHTLLVVQNFFLDLHAGFQVCEILNIHQLM